MYSPPYYRESKLEPIIQLIEKYSFAALLTYGGSESISHLPFLLDRNSHGDLSLLSHMAVANPHWQELEKVGKAKVVFQGPHAYISPAWYAPEPSNVPTWNYAVVHAVGSFEVIRDGVISFEIMNKLVKRFEDGYGTEWQLPVDELSIKKLKESIVVFKIQKIEFEAKFKLSQKQNPTDRHNVIKGLRNLNSATLGDLASYMEKT